MIIEKNLPPFLEIIEAHINNKSINLINVFILKGYFQNRNILFYDVICVSENVGSVQTIKYKILDIPPIISIYFFINDNINKLNAIINKLLNKDLNLKKSNII